MSIPISRARFLRLMGVSTAWSFVPRVTSANARRFDQGQDDDRRRRVSRIIESYDAQGIHRTGTEVDHASAAWLVKELQRSGATAALERFPLDRVDVMTAMVEADGTRIEGLPLFDGGSTDPDGIAGSLGAAGSTAPVILVRLDAAGIQSEGRSLAELRKSAASRGIVAVTSGALPGLSPTNAASFKEPFGLPVLQVGSEHSTWLDDLARRGRQVRLVVHTARTRTEAANVVASLPGRDRALPPVVVMTPRSGWWQCASERGGGLACWLEAVDAIARASSVRTVTFVASSGHELGHLGLEAFLAERQPLLETAVWIHLGANIGASGGQLRLQASDDAIEAIAAKRLEDAEMRVEQRVPRGTVPGGEARNIHVAGGRYVSLLGSSPFFHSPADRWPKAVDAQAVARAARAIADLVQALAGK
jgi:hypothetical protein